MNSESQQNHSEGCQKEVTVFIGGFPSSSSENQLRAYFKDYKSLSEIRIVKNKKGFSKGFGYLTFGSQEDADRAISSKHKLNGKMFRVRKLMQKASLDKDKAQELQRKVFVGGISKSTNEGHLEAYFSRFGEIEDILVNRSAKNGACKGCAFVLFKEETVAQRLINSSELHHVNGKDVECKASHKKGTKRRKTSQKVSVEGARDCSQAPVVVRKEPAKQLASGEEAQEGGNQPSNHNISNISVNNSETYRGSCRNPKAAAEKRIDFEARPLHSKLSLVLALSKKVAKNTATPSNIQIRRSGIQMTH